MKGGGKLQPNVHEKSKLNPAFEISCKRKFQFAASPLDKQYRASYPSCSG